MQEESHGREFLNFHRLYLTGMLIYALVWKDSSPDKDTILSPCAVFGALQDYIKTFRTLSQIKGHYLSPTDFCNSILNMTITKP